VTILIGDFPDNKRGYCLLTNISISGNGSVTKKKNENIENKKDHVMQNILNIKRTVVTSYKQASTTISLNCRKYLQNIHGNPLCRFIT
jgi:hypothetical protein